MKIKFDVPINDNYKVIITCDNNSRFNRGVLYEYVELKFFSFSIPIFKWNFIEKIFENRRWRQPKEGYFSDFILCNTPDTIKKECEDLYNKFLNEKQKMDDINNIKNHFNKSKNRKDKIKKLL